MVWINPHLTICIFKFITVYFENQQIFFYDFLFEEECEIYLAGYFLLQT